MSDTALLTVSRLLGLLGTGLLMGGSLGGMLMAVRRGGGARVQQTKRSLASFTSHRRLAMFGTALLLAHPLPLLGAAHRTGLGLMHLLVPFTAPRQTLSVSLGVAALHLLLIVLASSLLIKKVGRARWRALHYGAYPMLILGLLHGVLAGDFSGRLVAWTQPVKLALLLTAGAICVCAVWRVAASWRAARISNARVSLRQSPMSDRQQESLRRAA